MPMHLSFLRPSPAGTRRLLASLCVAAGACGGSDGASRTRAAHAAAVDAQLERDLALAAVPVSRSSASVLGDTARGESARGESARGETLHDRPAGASTATNATSMSSRVPNPPVATPDAPAPVPATASTEAVHVSPNPSSTVTAPIVSASASSSRATDASSDATGVSAGNGAGPSAVGNELPLGTLLIGKTAVAVCTVSNRPGDRFVLTTTSDAMGPTGARLPAGTRIVIELATALNDAMPDAGAEFTFRTKVVQIDSTLLPVQGRVQVDGVPVAHRLAATNQGTKVAGSAVAGAILGHLLGGGLKGAIIGAAGGAAAGSVVSSSTAPSEHCLPPGVRMSVSLSAPLSLASVRAPTSTP